MNECIYTSPVYNITKANNTITFSGNTEILITIGTGYYSIYTLQNAINSSSKNNTLDLKYNAQQQKYFIQNISGAQIVLNRENKLLKDCGFSQLVTDTLTLASEDVTVADTHPSLNIGTYIDIVVDEIPYKACKQNPQGFNIVHRLPIRSDSGSSIVYYKSNFIDHNFQHLFYPLNLSTLTIHLYMDGKELTLENLTISFEFELVILNK